MEEPCFSWENSGSHHFWSCLTRSVDAWRAAGGVWARVGLFVIIAPTTHALAGPPPRPVLSILYSQWTSCLLQASLLRPSTKVVCFTDKFWVPHTGLVDCPSNLNWHLNFHRYAKISRFFFLKKSIWKPCDNDENMFEISKGFPGQLFGKSAPGI